jgi:hypothetical protein
MPEDNRRFPIDPSRLYDVADDGTPSTDTATAPEWLGPRHRHLLAWAALGAGATGGLAGLTVLCFVLWAAGFALATLAAAPLLGIGPLLDWWRHQRPHRRRHRQRSPDFPAS